MSTRFLIPLLLPALLAAPAATGASRAAVELLRDAAALEPDVRAGAATYREHCADCHGAEAWGGARSAVPALAGQHESYLLGQLVDFATLERGAAPDMHRLLRQPTLSAPQTLRNLAAWLAAQKPVAEAERGDGRRLEVGERVYARACAQCHGKRGEGSAEEPIPQVGGQHYSYLVLQLRNFATGHRTLVEPPVLDFAAGLSSDEIDAVADFLSRQTWSQRR